MSVFAEIKKESYLFESKYFFMVYDSYPVSEGHLLIISKENKPDYFSLTEQERNELQNLIIKAKELIEENHSPDGYNIGMNCGESAGQTVFHFHCHIIPRYKGDMDNPRGGVRHCITGKGYY
jgi:diadenosine tetraphosphate (Ap4A) HIT family hydrolase